MFLFLISLILLLVFFKKIKKENFDVADNDNFDKTNYTLINNNIQFILNDAFKTHILDFFKLNNIYLNDKLTIIDDLKDIYVKKENDTYYYIFKVNLNNLTKFFVKTTNVKLKVENNNIHIISIHIDDNKNTNTIINVSENDESNPNYYEIKNTLYLTDPFITSGKDMVISDSMKLDFNNILINKTFALQQQQQQQ